MTWSGESRIDAVVGFRRTFVWTAYQAVCPAGKPADDAVVPTLERDPDADRREAPTRDWEGRRREILDRLDEGFYDAPEQVEIIARRVLEDLKHVDRT